MSRLQERAKPLLRNLVVSGEQLNSESAKILAAWAAMTTMVHEFADPSTVSVSQEDRNFLLEFQLAPPNWYVWHGAVKFDRRHPGNITTGKRYLYETIIMGQ